MGRDARLTEAELLQRQREIAAAGPRLRDRFNRPLFVGVQVELHEPLPIVFTVMDIRPVIDPRQPAGLWTLDLHASVQFPVLNGQPIVSLTGVAWPKEMAAMTRPQEAAPETPTATPETPVGASTEQPAIQDNDQPAGASEYHPPDDGEGSTP